MDRRATSSSARACCRRAARAGRVAAAAHRRRRRSASRAWGRRAPGGSSASPTGRRSATLMAGGGGETSKIPSGFTYLGQFIDHDLTFDKTDRDARHDTSRPTAAAAGALARASTSTRSTAPGPQDPASAKFYEADGMHLKMGKTRGRRRHPGQERLRPAARRRLVGGGQAQGDHPRPAQRREPRGRPDPPAR